MAEETVDEMVKRLLGEQAVLDTATREMADEIVEAQNPKTLEDARGFAAAWIGTAAQHARNEAYWRERATRAEAEVVRLGGTEALRKLQAG